MKKLLLIALLIMGCVFGREYIAIIDFEGIGVTEDEAKILTQRLTSEMIALEVYQVIERKEMKRLLEEQKFQYSGCVDMKCAVEIGKMIGTKYMVVGSISKVGKTYSVDSRLISVETGESYSSAFVETKGEIDNLFKGMKNIASQLCFIDDKGNSTISTIGSSYLPIEGVLKGDPWVIQNTYKMKGVYYLPPEEMKQKGYSTTHLNRVLLPPEPYPIFNDSLLIAFTSDDDDLHYVKGDFEINLYNLNGEFITNIFKENYKNLPRGLYILNYQFPQSLPNGEYIIKGNIGGMSLITWIDQKLEKQLNLAHQIQKSYLMTKNDLFIPNQNEIKTNEISHSNKYIPSASPEFKLIWLMLLLVSIIGIASA